MNVSGEPADRRVLQVAAEVSDVADNVVPRVLVKLQGVLDSYPKGSKAFNKVKLDIWSLGLIPVALTSLKHEYGTIIDGWNLASKVASIVCATCAGLDPTDREKFYTESMPDIVHTVLMAARKLQTKFSKTSDILEDTKKDLLGYCKTIIDGITLLCSGPEEVALQVVKSPWLLQMLLADDPRSCILVTGLIQSISRMKPGLYGQVDVKLTNQFMDELVYKLSASNERDLASAACQTINAMCESHTPVVELLCKRYKNWLPKQMATETIRGLRYLLELWKNQGFERDLYRLEQLLQAGSMRQAELQKKHEAAMLVQSLWRSYSTRKKLKKAGVAMATFQRSFRKRRVELERDKENARMESELRHILMLRHRKAMRSLHGRKLEALQILPAGEVEKFLERENHNAAVHIQRHWRGHYARKDNVLRHHLVLKTRAAVLIQRTVRKWLERVKARRREPPAWQRPPGLTDDRRIQLQQKILEWRENHEVQCESKEGREELHYKVQDMIKQFAIQSRTTRRNHQRRELLLSRIGMDADLLMDAPKLTECTDDDVEDFVSRSVPIATKARFNHTQELRLLRQPWWRKLGDEYQDQKYEEETESWKMF